MQDTTPDQRTDVSTTTQRQRERLATRLADAGLDKHRSTPAKNGTKISYNHDDRKSPTDLTGNYTVFGGGDLTILDVDVAPIARPDWLTSFPTTFEIASPHGDGRHRYYAIADDTGISNTKDTSDDEWGSLRYKDQYVIGPGSTINHAEACDKAKEGCPGVGVGEYTIERDVPIATLSGDHLNRLREFCEDDKVAEGSGDYSHRKPRDTGNRTELSSLDAKVRRRLKRAENFDKWGDQFVALKEGRYADAGFDDDRSRAEFRLVEILGWLFDDDKAVVQRTMTAICRMNPQTTVRNQEGRKWLERDGDYRDLVLNKACQHESTYNTRTVSSPKSRPEVSAITKSKVFEAVLDLCLASSKEIADHENVDRKVTQVQQALKEYCEDGHIQWVRDGRETLYYFGAPFIPADERDEYNL